MDHITTWCRVRMGPWKPGKSWNLKIWILGLESPGSSVEVLESPGIWTFTIISWSTCGIAELMKRTSKRVGYPLRYFVFYVVVELFRCLYIDYWLKNAWKVEISRSLDMWCTKLIRPTKQTAIYVESRLMFQIWVNQHFAVTCFLRSTSPPQKVCVNYNHWY